MRPVLKERKRRPGGGRKKKPGTVLREMDQAYRIVEAEKSFRFMVGIRDNAKVPWGIRVEAAKDIQDRVFGKPKQSTDLTSGGKNLADILKEVYSESGSQSS